MADASKLTAGDQINVYRGTDKHFVPSKWVPGTYVGRGSARGYHRVEIADEDDGRRVVEIPARRIGRRRSS